MTAVEHYPPGAPPPLSGSHQGPGVPHARDVGGLFFPGAPTPDELIAAKQRAAALLIHQNAGELRQVKTVEELHNEAAVDAAHRAALLNVETIKNEAAIARAKQQIEFDNKQAERALAVKDELAEAENADEVAAARARSLLRSISSAAGVVAAHYRRRKWALIANYSPSVVAVLLGSVNVQQGWTRMLELESNAPLWWFLFGLELLATLQVIGIMIFEGANLAAITSLRDKPRRSFRRETKQLLAISIVVNVFPHLWMHEWGGLGWLWVPLAIAMSMHQGAKLNREFCEEIRAAHMEAELVKPVGPLPGLPAKLLRQIRTVLKAERAGQLGGLREEHGLPSNNQIYQALKAANEGGGRNDAAMVGAALKILNEVVD